MSNIDYRGQIDQEIQQLGIIAQQRVLEFAKSLRHHRENDESATSSVVDQFVGSIALDDLELMRTAIEDGCEQVDVNGW